MREFNASDLPRVMQCAGALNLAERAPRFEKQESESRRESEAAHYVLNALLTNPQEVPEKCPNGYIVTDEMEEHITTVAAVIRYRDFDATIHPMDKLDWAVPGTDKEPNVAIRTKPDCIGWNAQTHTLYVDELKYGWRPVEVRWNWQMIAAAIGAFIRRGYAAERVVFTLHQPRPFHPEGKMRQWVMNRDDLADARLRIIKQTKRVDEVCDTGPECYGCPAASICPAAAMAAAAAIDVSCEGVSDTIDSQQLGYELLLLERAAEALKVRKKALEEIATDRLQHGQNVNHWGLQSGQGNRKWLDGIDANVIQSVTGVDVSEIGIISPAKAEKKGVSKDIINSFTTRPSTGFKLVRQDLSKLFGSK